ncbi:MAG: DUF6503 family protein [Gemmatimonadota bacterium]
MFATSTLALAIVLTGCAEPEPAAGDGAVGAGETSAARELLARSIRFHDPEGLWATRTVRLAWNGTGADGEERVALDLTLQPDGRTFSMSGRYRGRTIDYSIAEDRLTVTVDGSAEMPDETREAMRLLREEGMFWRGYFGFLVGLPMKLNDPGTHIDPEPADTEFMGRAVQSIRVTYDPDVGGEIWYFYFDPETTELVGSRFYYDESANDGEYLIFEGLAEADGLRLPMRRSWYVNADSTFLGADEVSGLTVAAG